MMNKEKKQNYISEMTSQFDKSEAVIVAHYQGLTVKQLDECLDSLNNLKFTKSELKQIDKYAKEEKINLWAPSSKH